MNFAKRLKTTLFKNEEREHIFKGILPEFFA